MKNFDGRTLGSDNWYLKIPVFIWHRQWKNINRCYSCLCLSWFPPQNRIHACCTRLSLLFRPLLKGRLVKSFKRQLLEHRQLIKFILMTLIKHFINIVLNTISLSLNSRYISTKNFYFSSHVRVPKYSWVQKGQRWSWLDLNRFQHRESPDCQMY